MNIIYLQKISKLISIIFFALITILICFIILLSFKPLKINYYSDNIENYIFTKEFQIKKIGDIYLSFNKFSKNFEFIVENLETDNVIIPNLLLGIDFNNLISFNFTPNILKIYDSKIIINLKNNQNDFINDPHVDNFKKLLNIKNSSDLLKYFKIVELNNSFITIKSENKIDIGFVDLKLENKNNSIKCKGLIQNEEEKYLSFSYKKVDNINNLKLDAKDYNINFSDYFLSDAVFKKLDFNFTGKLNLDFSDKLEILNITSKFNFKSLIKKGNETFKIKNGKFFLDNDFKKELIKINLNFFDSNSQFNIAYTINKKTFENTKINLKLNKINSKLLMKYWPEDFNESAYNWIIKNINGTINEFYFNYNFLNNKYDGSFRFSDVDIIYTDTMPKIEKISGHAIIDMNLLKFKINSGYSENLNIESGDVEIFDLEKSIEKIKINLIINSKSNQLYKYLRKSPLKKGSYIKINEIVGNPRLFLEMKFPLLLDLQLSEIEYVADLIFEKAIVKKVFQEKNINDTAIKISIDKDEIIYSGNGNYDGLPVKFKGFENLRNKYKKEKVEIDLDLTPSFINRKFPYFIKDFKGKIPLKIFYHFNEENNNAKIIINGNLSPFYGIIDILELTHNYENGEISSIINYNKLKKNIFSENSIISDKLNVSFKTFSQNNLLKKILIKEIISPNQEFGGTILISDDSYDLNIKGEKINLKNFLKNENNNSKKLNLKFNFDIKELVIDKIPINDPLLNGETSEGNFKNLNFKFKKEDLIHELQLNKINNELLFNLYSEDGSYFLNVLGFNKNIKKGKLKIDGKYKNQLEKYIGKIYFDDFIVYDVPLFAKLLTLFSIDGLEQKLIDGGVSFDSLRADYEFDNNEIKFLDGFIKGSDIGLTFNGDFNTYSEDYDISGTFIPVYTLNTLLTSVPIIGDIISYGSPEEGILAASFDLKRENKLSQNSFNPVSVLVPSLIKNLLKFKETN